MSAPFDPLTVIADTWRWGLRAQQAWAATLLAPVGIERLQRERLTDLVRHAQAHSLFYRHHHRDALDPSLALDAFAPVDKKTLMAHFDEWVTDPRVRLEEVMRFIADPDRVGEPYAGGHAVWTSSGSTGTPGIFVHDADALAIYDALLTTRFRAAGAVSPLQALASGGRFALIAAIGGHFAGVVSWERLRREFPLMRSATKAFSVLAPIRELVAELNEFAPTVIASYPTSMLLLAREREAGRLKVAPQALWSGGETLAQAEREEIARAFGCPVVDGYGASECMNIACDCGRGVLHVNSDWVILEPVDTERRPVAPGERGASVLLTNLANHTQPLIRYDLGDSVTFHAEPCACGSVFPAISVEGRRDDIVALKTRDGDTVPMAPLALATALEEGAGVHRFQICQAGARTLDVRFETPPHDNRSQAWHRIERSLRAFLEQQGLRGIRIRCDDSPVQADPVSGKLREVLGLRATRH
jgi:phenylacetate-coenzyme A ligase PaaK-like adenylate-forming protein